MTKKNIGFPKIISILLCLLAPLAWWGISFQRISEQVLRVEFFGSILADLNRDAWVRMASDPASWIVSLVFTLLFAFFIYLLLSRIFQLTSIPAKGRAGLFSVLMVLIFISFNPILAMFLKGVPANFNLLAFEVSRSITCVFAFLSGLSVMALLLQFKAARIFSFAEQCAALVFSRRFVLLIVTVICVATLWIRLGPLEGRITVSDEASYLKQAEIFAKGGLSEPSLRPLGFSNGEQMVNDGKTYSKYPPGTSICFLPAVFFNLAKGAPVLFLTINFCLTWLLVKRIFDRKVALLTLILAAASPFFVSMGQSYLSHNPGLTAMLGMTYFHALWLDTKRNEFAFLSGLLGALLLLIRPVTAAAIVLPLFIHGQIKFRGAAKKRVASGLLLILALASGLGFMLWYNHAQTGDMWMFPYQKYASVYTPYDRFCTDNAPQGLLNSAFNLSRINNWLLGFSPSLLPAAAILLFWAAASWDLLFIFTFLLLAASYVFHWFWGTCWYGPLYFYECSIFLILLTARGLILVFNRLTIPGAPKKGAALIMGLCLFLFAGPSFQIQQVTSASDRVKELFKPMDEALEHSPEIGSWVILKDRPPAFKANYMGAAPTWMTGGVRFLNGNLGDPKKLKSNYPIQGIHILKENNTLEEVK